MSSKDLSQKADMTDIPNWFPFGRCQKTLPSQEKLVIYYPLDNWEWGKFERYHPNNVAFFSASRCCKRERERETEWNKNWRVTTFFFSLIGYVTFPTTKDSWRLCRPWLLQESQDTVLKSFYPTHSCHLCHPSWKAANSSKIASIIGFHPSLFPMSASPYQHQGQTSEFCIRFLVKFKIHQIWDPQDPTNAYGKWSITKLSQERN